MVMLDRSNKDVGQIARATIDTLPVAQRNDCKQILRHLIKHNTEAHGKSRQGINGITGVLSDHGMVTSSGCDHKTSYLHTGA